MMEDYSMAAAAANTSPFDMAEVYRRHGWSGTLALPARAKKPPPDGFTGADGRWPTADDLARWRGGSAALNIALRPPHGVIGLDVDDYDQKCGAATLATLTAKWGELPATWRSTSRGVDNVSGIRWFRVPHTIHDWPSQAGPDIEVVRFAHRYAVVWPSVHPEGGEYVWVRPDGTVADGDIPRAGDLAELPAAWIAGLAGVDTNGKADPDHVRPGSRAERRAADAEARTWLKTLPKGEPCAFVGRLAADALEATRREGGSAYENTRDATLALLRAGEAGHPGVGRMLKRVGTAYVETVAASRGGKSVAEGEFVRFTLGGVRKVLAQPGVRAGRGCDCPATGRQDADTTTGPDGGDTEAATAPAYVTMAELLANPESLKPPQIAAPRLAWRGRVSLFAAREKDGKSTVACHAAAAVSHGGILFDGLSTRGTVLYVALEEHVSDVLVRLVACNADPDRIAIQTSHHLGADDPLGVLAAVAAELKPALIVIDTLAALANLLPSPPDAGDSRAWTPIMARLTQVARDTDAALVLLAHSRKSDGRYRDSTAIAAGVDVVLEMAARQDSEERTVRCKGRWAMDNFAYVLTDGRLELVGDVPLTTRIKLFVGANPDCSANAVYRGVGGKRQKMLDAIRQMIADGEFQDRASDTTSSALRVRPEGGSDAVFGQYPEPTQEEGVVPDANTSEYLHLDGSGTGSAVSGTQTQTHIMGLGYHCGSGTTPPTEPTQPTPRRVRVADFPKLRP
jgi:hypothetical protein